MRIRKLLTANEVSELLGVSNSYAYKIIRDLNTELKTQGYLTINGKVDSLYVERRFFPSSEEEDAYAAV